MGLAMKRRVLTQALLMGLVARSVPAFAANLPPLQETPGLRDKVKSGALPPVTERLPKQPRVLEKFSGADGIGKHGGQLNMLVAATRDTRLMTIYSYTRLIVYDDKFKLHPDILESYEVKDGREFTLKLRAGHKWSDGHPFTTEDFRFFWEDIANNKDLSPNGPSVELLVEGKPPKVEILDEVTIRYSWDKPNPDFIESQARAAPLFLFRPAHYLKKLHGKYTAEEEILKARMEAEQANMAKSEFLSRMSHELRTPMNSILGFSQLLQMSDLTPGQNKGVNHIMHSGKHLLDLINEVLDISRIESGRLSLSLEPVQLAGLIGDMTGTMAPLARDYRVKIIAENSPDDALFVRADRQRLKQVLLNLITNAVKYNKQDGTVTIKTKVLEQESSGLSYHRISVADTGTGIQPEDIGKLFKPFERIGAEKTAIEGSGLGLAVVKKLMDAMGGKVGVESTRGIGTTFWIDLPTAESQFDKLDKSGILKEPLMATEKMSGKVLYIEDNLSNIELVDQILSSQRPDIRLLFDTHGNNALPLAIEHRPNLILLDLNLPDIHGNEVFAMLQENELTKDIPVVVISADAMPHQLEKLLLAGVKDYLTKPLDIKVFLKIVDEFLGSPE